MLITFTSVSSTLATFSVNRARNRSLVGLYFQPLIDEKVIVVAEVTSYYHDNFWKRSGRHVTSARTLDLSPRRRAVGPYERLLEERVEEEQRRGGPLPRLRSTDSKILVRRLEDAPWGMQGYVADLSTMHRLIARDPPNAGEGMRLGSLKAKYREEYGEEYGELRAERQGQQGLL